MEPTTREKTTMEKLSVPIAIVLAGGLIGVAL
jgi:hypothetical protein